MDLQVSTLDKAYRDKDYTTFVVVFKHEYSIAQDHAHKLTLVRSLLNEHKHTIIMRELLPWLQLTQSN